MMKNTKRYTRKSIHKGYCFEVVRDHVKWPNGLKLHRDLIIHGGISVMIPVANEKELILIRQFRYGADSYLWELPAGTIGKGESPLQCAKREIQEEIGFKASRWKKIASFYVSPGFNTEKVHCFTASNLKKTRTNLERDEILESQVLPFKEVVRMIKTNKIRDAKSLIPLFYFFAREGML